MRSLIIPGLLLFCLNVRSQNASPINEKEVSRIENILAADDMQGRQVFTKGIEKAADFIVKEFK